MSKYKDLIKKDLDEDFTPLFQDLKKGTGIAPTAPAPTGGGKPPAPPKAPKAPSAPSKPPSTPKAPTMHKPVGTGFKKDVMDPESRYHIHKDGARITQDHETVTLKDVHKKYGGVKSLESKGFRLVPQKKEVKKSEYFTSQLAKSELQKHEEMVKDIMGGHKPMFLGNMKDLAKSNPLVVAGALPYGLIKGDVIDMFRKKPKKDKSSDDSSDESGSDMKATMKRNADNKKRMATDRKTANEGVKRRNRLDKEELEGKVIAGDHIPTDRPDNQKTTNNPKLKSKDEGSGGKISKKDIPANKIIKPIDESGKK